MRAGPRGDGLSLSHEVSAGSARIHFPDGSPQNWRVGMGWVRSERPDPPSLLTWPLLPTLLRLPPGMVAGLQGRASKENQAEMVLLFMS